VVFEAQETRQPRHGASYMATLKDEVNSRGWRRMPVVELEDLILAIRRRAERQHLSPSEWLMVDHMRARAAKLWREAGR